MLFAISHRTKLIYSEPISESVMEFRAMPRTDDKQVLHSFDIQATPRTRACTHTDWLGNLVHQFSLHQPHRHVTIASFSKVETRSTVVALHELTGPLEGVIRDHRSWDFVQHHGRVDQDPSLPTLATRIGLDSARNVGQAIDIVTQRTRDLIAYRPGVTQSSSSVSQVLRLGAGVCQDFAHLSLAMLRHLGLPCRYVSGYLYKPDATELQSHAWAEAFVPEIGWLAFDPSHRQLANENYVTVAVGRSYADVPPNRGIYRGEAQERVEATVNIRPVETRAQLTPYSTRAILPSPAAESQPIALVVRQALRQEPALVKVYTRSPVAQRLPQPQ